ncbi:MAG: transcription termination/antitermination protein NusA [Chloroflexi bacterium]|jgi:transcription termination/antitermination protein NusA|nr:transcription termination/antitermination protein NusA [Chloroflexota bacterium]MBT7082207.1 transcription termination/antitermination protein NusA [Chloroflexota bacterium]
MKSDFLVAITQLAAEKNLPKDLVLKSVEAALVSAYKKDTVMADQDVAVKISPGSGEVKVYLRKLVVEEPNNPDTEIAIKEAKKIKSDIEVDDILDIEITPANAGRIAAQTAKQVVLQRLREAERDMAYEEYVDKEGQIILGVIQRVEPRQIIVELGKSEAVMPTGEQVRTERYRVGQRLKFYVAEVRRTGKGPQIAVSRAHPNLLRCLFELEVPEILNGSVEVKGIAREAGHRSKVAVWANQEGLDPVGSCVGLRGVRIQNIANELNGERIDIVHWDESTEAYIANALSPAQVSHVTTNDEFVAATVVVPDNQLSLAIGKEGQNVRLAAKLTGWKIDIKSLTIAAQEAELKKAEQAEAKEEEKQSEEEEVVAEVQVIEEEVVAESAPVAEVSETVEEVVLSAKDVLPEFADIDTVEEEKEEEEEEAEEEEEEEEEGVLYEPEFSIETETNQIRFAEDILGYDRFGGGKNKTNKGKKGKKKKGSNN